ncbi:DUF4215 domain-containing protein [Enhygromyxa salina]|uniref:DUF4215 domain-containing protein n=1 Tax=Enhygromyxa salina TaxID=215803 RepID=UPI00215993A5|nr:DUF4215 domain-containing protein [Enhygromyxa salina]
MACTPDPAGDGGLSTFSTTLPGDGDGDGDGDGETGSGDGDGDGDGDSGGVDCGDGVVQAGEECDLGNENSESGQCTPNCKIAACGDGFVYEGFEECDDGNAVNTDDCVEGCSLAVCGDGFVHEGFEMCDDGNDDDADGCNSRCLPGECGDGILQDGEQCDDGNDVTTDNCPACQLAFCGDGFIQAGVEICDDGNDLNTDGCISPTCVPAACGDGNLWEGMETCDDGNDDDNDACPASCEPAFCGDGFTWSGNEECDDANDVDDDGCTNDCISNGASCADIQTDMSVWGQSSSGVDLRSYTNSTLHYIGCPADGCPPDTFYCDYDPNAGTLQFGTNASAALRAAIDPDDQNGDDMPDSYGGCCNAPLGLCNAPNSTNNGVGVDMVTALCNALGYASGSIVREVASNSCPEIHAISQDGQEWGSDFVSSQGYGAEYLCSNQ